MSCGYGRMSKTGVVGLFFVKHGIKVNGKYYVGVLQLQPMLPAIKHDTAGDNFVFQKDSAPAHRVRDTIELLQREKPDVVHWQDP